MTPPPRWKMAVVTWLGVYPLITLLLLALGPLILGLPIPVVTLILSVRHRQPGRVVMNWCELHFDGRPLAERAPGGYL